MALSEVLVVDAVTWQQGYPVGGAHVLSDRTLACVVATANGSNWDVAIYTSIDAGLTWSSALSIYTNQDSAGFYPNWVGDTLYGVFAPGVVNESAKFYQADYTAATASWALTKSAKVIQTEATGGWILNGMVDKEYGGTRLWAGLHHFTSGNPYTVAKYSDDGGDTWTAAYSSAVQSDYFVFLYALEFNIVLTSAGYYGSTAGVWETHHKYTDAAGTWSAYAQVIPLTYAGAVYHQHAAAKATGTPPKSVWLAGVDLAAATKHAHFGWVVEDGSGVISTGTQVDSFNTAAGETYGIGVTAYTDGAQFFYVYSGTLSTMRRRNFNTGASWGSESTWTLSTALGGANWFSVAIRLNYPMDYAHLILSAVGATTARRLWALFENINYEQSGSRDIVAEVLRQVDPARSMPAEVLRQVVSTEHTHAEVLRQVAEVRELPTCIWGWFLAIKDSFDVLVIFSEGFLDQFDVIPASMLAEFQDSFDVQELPLNNRFIDAFDVLEPKLVALFARDQHLPVATVART